MEMKMDNLFSVKDFVIIVTGAGRGNGRAINDSLEQNGALVYGFDLEFLSEGNNKIIGDITDKDFFQKQCNIIYKKHRRIDAIINNAGISITKKENELYPENLWNKTISVNLTALFNCCQIVAEFMFKNKKGSIVNITSLGAKFGFPNNPAYVASKGGVKMLTKSLARDWGRKGIRVNNVAPGYIITDMTRSSYDNLKLRKQREQNIMLGRWGKPEDLVGACIFLISDASQYITGQDIYIDGGWSANGLQYF